MQAGFLTSSCSINGQETSKSNFKRVIGQVMQHRPYCVPRSVPEAVPVQNGRAEPSRRVAALVHVGLAEGKSTMLSAALGGYVPAKPGSPQPIPGVVYQLTEKAKKYEGTTSTLFNEAAPGFCYATATIVEVVRYTEPTNTPFGRMTTVTFSYRLTQIADWAKDPEIKAAFFLQNEIDSADQVKESSMPLVLTNEGWRNQP